MSAHYAMCKYDDDTGTYVPLEVRPITDTLKNDDPLYQEGFQAGAASRDAEVIELRETPELLRGSIRALEEERDQLRAELAAALAACKVKDEALNTIVVACYPKGIWQQARDALAIQPDDSALKAWLGEPVAWKDATDGVLFHSKDLPTDIPLYSPKELK